MKKINKRNRLFDMILVLSLLTAAALANTLSSAEASGRLNENITAFFDDRAAEEAKAVTEVVYVLP